MSLNRRFYVLVGRVLSPFALLGLKFYTLLTNRPRVRVLVTDEQGDVLLIKGIISKHGWWTLPGGGVERHERLAHAAKRELYEETGMVKPLEAFTHLRTIPKAELGLGFVAPLFHIVVQRADLSAEQYNPTEVAAIDWFSPDALPTDTAPLVRTALAEYHAQKASKN
jgi:8-oxo-dGTP pyrophosphatase MutT (NUDIX family)